MTQVPNGPQRIYRHSVPVRLWHWLNALCFLLLLLSGFQIFNAHPRLYWGHTGYDGMPAVLEITGNGRLNRTESWVQIGTARVLTTGVLGAPEEIEFIGVRNAAFPWWLRLPSENDLALGRGWHFTTAWILVLNLAAYIIYLLRSRRLQRALLPERAQLRQRAILADLRMHLLLRHHTGMEAARYNFLQKLSYLTVIFLFLPLMIASGMTMSNSAVAAFPWLIDFFGGRQTARTVHFVVAISLSLFFLVHLFQVFVAGFRREMKSILTGYYDVPEERSA